MTSHHHPPPYAHPYCPPTACIATSNTCFCYDCHHPPPDPHFIHHPTFPPPPPTSCHSHPHSTAQNLHPHRQLHNPPPQTKYQNERYYQELHRFQDPERGLSQSHPIVESLLRRIVALESTLHRHASSRSHSLRDAAACIIQTHFRAFLVRRSRALGQLKELASIRSALNVLRSSIYEDACFNPRFFTKETLNLLRRLDLVQGDDPMIRDGKMSVGRELSRFMDSIDGFCLKRSELFSRVVVKKNRRPVKETNKPLVQNTDYGLGRTKYNDVESKKVQDVAKRIDAMYDKVQGIGEDDEEDENLDSPAISGVERNDISSIRSMNLTNRRSSSDQDKTTKRVSFAEKGYVYRIPSRHCQDSVGSDNDDRHDPSTSKNTIEDDMGWEAVEVIGAALDDKDKDDEVSSAGSDDGDRSPTPGSAQLPVRMEARPKYMEMKSNVKRAEPRS